MTAPALSETRRAFARFAGAYTRAVCAVLALLLWGEARADRREVYTVLGCDPGVSRYDLGSTGTGAATRFAGTANVSAYYGLTNTWHVGGRLRFASSSNIHIGNAVVSMPDGTKAQGSVYEDHRSIGAGALLLYRVDTHAPVAPLLELEGGFTEHQFERIAFIPGASTHSYAQPSVSGLALHGSAAVLVEYRFLSRWVAAAGIAMNGESGHYVPWGLSVPLRVGMVW